MRILLIEDDRKAARLLAKGLLEEGFVVDVAPTGEDGEEKATVNEYDVIVLDWLLPGKDGLAARRVARGDGAVTLTPREYAILETLMRNAGEVVSRTRLAERVWDDASEVLDNLLDVHVSHLRNKIDHGASVPLIHTIRGVGYRLGPPESAEP